MKDYICYKCGKTIGGRKLFICYSFSQKKMVDLCFPCIFEHTKALEKADEDFFKTEGKT